MNTIEEILKSKNIYQYYVDKLCISCSNKNNSDDLCNITQRLDRTVKCDNYERCMTNKCKTCDKEKECFNTTKKKELI